jgi:hypothetical protein
MRLNLPFVAVIALLSGCVVSNGNPRPDPPRSVPPGHLRSEEVHERNEERKAHKEEEKRERKEEKKEEKDRPKTEN